MVIIKIKGNDEKNNNLTLFDLFNLGDRVNVKFINNTGEKKKYSGIVMSINKESIEVFWDKINGRYKPEKNNFTFNTFEIDDIINGNENFSPIKKKISIYFMIYLMILFNIFNYISK